MVFAPAAGLEAATTRAPALAFAGAFGSLTLPSGQRASFNADFALVSVLPVSFGTVQEGAFVTGGEVGEVDSDGWLSTSGPVIVGGTSTGAGSVKETGAEHGEPAYLVSTSAENALVVPAGTETAIPGDAS